ncbi:hypothetical protein [Amycolatopsis sp. YIM 10]|uniref:hypothetical protein n=1 Tax=Amycolatopsis sp. YIM 10 TaxID=2653857 RepID=UPI0018842849|nr:hypothetical protein [Amycolatopsis sp. YIM 10]
MVEVPRPAMVGAELAGRVRIDYARASTICQSLDTQLDSLAEAEAPACSPRRSPPAFLVRGNPCRMSRDANDDGLG